MQWHAESSPKEYNVYIDVQNLYIRGYRATLIEHFEDLEHQYEKIYDLLKNKQVLNLVYEMDIESDPNVAHTKILDFLNLDMVPQEIRFARTNPYKTIDVISNFDEVENAI